MRAIVLTTAILTACGPQLGNPCGRKLPCDDGAVCDFTDPEGPVCISAEGDLDGDGLANDRDFCHHAPGGEFDEEGDGIGDDCDPCPIANPPSSPDADGDAVDRPCDPYPTETGEQITFFEGFNSGALPDGAKAIGAWQFDGATGAALIDARGNEDAVLTFFVPVPSPQLAVTGEYAIDDLDGSVTENLIGVLGRDERPAGVTEIACLGSRAGLTDSVLVIGDLGSAQTPISNAFSQSKGYRATLDLERTSAGCALVANDDDAAATQTTIRGESMTEAGLFARGTTARFRFVLAIQSP